MRAAGMLGLSSEFLDEFDAEALRSGFGVPDDHAICGLVALGSAGPVRPFLGRFGLDELCYAEHFGQPWTG
jgi:hypothetical protein